MKKYLKISYIPLLFLFAVFCTFFYKAVFFKQIPFPGDLLVSTSPFKTESYGGYAPGGYPNKAQGRDVITQLFPWKYLAVEQIKKGQFPFWNPYNFSGNVLFENYQSGVFYPLNIIFFIFPFSLSWAIFVLLQALLALFFMYLFLREIHFTKVPSIIGSVSFGFSSFMVVWLEYGNIGHTFLWIPLILFCISKLYEKIRIGWFVLLTFSLLSAILAGFIQIAFYVVFLAFLYASYRFFEKKKQDVIHAFTVFLGFAVAFGIATVNIFPTLIFFFSSTRGSYSLSQIQNLLNPWYYLVTLFSSDFFGNPATRNFYLPITYFERVAYFGVPMLFFVFYALPRMKKTQMRFFAIVGMFTLLITTNFFGISYFYLLPIPVLSTTVPTRFLGIFMFCMIVVGSYGIDRWLKSKNKSTVPYIFAAFYILIWVVLFLLPKFFPTLSENISISKHNFIFSTSLAFAVLCIFYLKNKYIRLSSVLLIVVVLIDLFYVFNKFTPFSPISLVFPQTPVLRYLEKHQGINRSWGYGNAYIPANYQTVYHIFSADGYDALHVRAYGELLNSSTTGKLLYPLSRGDANIAPGYGETDLKSNPYRQQILNLLGVKYIINLNENLSGTWFPDNDGFPPDQYKLIWQEKSWQIYENKNALPRFFLTPQYAVTPDSQKALSAIYTTDLRRTLILSQIPMQETDKSATGQVLLIAYKPNIVSFSIQTTGRQFLFLSDTYDSTWKAKIDGVEVPIYKTDYAFRSVEVPQGNHTVVFFSSSSTLIVSVVIAVISVFSGIAYIFFLTKKKSNLLE